MKLYWADYHQDTRHLTRSQHGAYLLLIGEAWRLGGSLPNDDGLLALWTLSTSDEWADMKGVILSFFTFTRGQWVHSRVRAELAKYETISCKRKAAGKRGGSSSIGKDSENKKAIAKQLPTKPEPEPYIEDDEEVSSSSKTLGRQATHRGTRLPADWQPSEIDIAFGLSEGLSREEIARGADEFRDYWIAVAGQRGTKRDWVSTFRNRLRALADRKRERGARMAARSDIPAGSGRGATSFADLLVRRGGSTAN